MNSPEKSCHSRRILGRFFELFSKFLVTKQSVNEEQFLDNEGQGHQVILPNRGVVGAEEPIEGKQIKADVFSGSTFHPPPPAQPSPLKTGSRCKASNCPV